MPYLAIENFKGGLDKRRMELTSEVGSLQTLKNAHITRGGEIEKSLAFVQSHSLPAGTFGFAIVKGQIYVFGSDVEPGGMPADVEYQRLQNPDSADMTAVVSIDIFAGKLYVVADFDDNTRHHFYDGVIIPDWYIGLVRSSLSDNDGIAEHLRALIAESSGHTVTRSGSTLTITGSTSDTIDITALALNGDGNTYNNQTAVVATTQEPIEGQIEVLSKGSFRVTGGTNTPGTNRITSVKVDGIEILGGPAEVLASGSFTITGGTNSAGVNTISAVLVNGVDVLGASIDHTGNNSTTADAIRTQINSYASSPNYTASGSGAQVIITAVAGSGSSPNGFVVNPTENGDVTTGSVSNMSGGSYSGVQWATSNSVTAAAVVTQINSYSSSPEYTASSSGDKVTLTALAGTGDGPNGRVVGVTKEGDVTISDITNMAGGVDGGSLDVETPIGTFNQAYTLALSVDNGVHDHFGTTFIATKDSTITTVKINVAGLTFAGTYKAALFTDNAGSPGVIIGAYSADQNISTTGDKTFALGAGATVTSGQKYWIVFQKVSGTQSISLSLCNDQPNAGFGRNNTVTSMTEGDYPGYDLRIEIVQASAGQPQISTVTIGGTFEEGDLFSVTIDDKVYGADRVTGLQVGSTLKVHKNKVYTSHKSTMLFSGVAEPTKWQAEDTGSGAIDMSSQASGFEDITAISVYQNNLAVFSRNTTQVFFVDPNPDSNQQLQVLENIGTRSPGSVVGFGDSDVFFLSDTGVRSLRARDSSNTAAVSDVGTPIDPIIVPLLSTLTDAQITKAKGIIEPKDGRYILSLGTVMYVFSFFPSSRVSSWSTYERALEVDWFAKSGTKIYARVGNLIYLLGGAAGTTYDNTSVVVELPYINGGKLANWKGWTGIDMAVEGTWVVEYNSDPNQPTVWETIATISSHTIGELNAAVQAFSPVFKLRFTNTTTAAAKIGSILVHYKETKQT